MITPRFAKIPKPFRNSFRRNCWATWTVLYSACSLMLRILDFLLRRIAESLASNAKYFKKSSKIMRKKANTQQLEDFSA